MYNNFKFNRCIDSVVYYFERCKDRNSYPSWKRVDMDIWLTYIPRKGWCTVDSNNNVNGKPWDFEVTEQGTLPPECVWVSKKGNKSYVYDLVHCNQE